MILFLLPASGLWAQITPAPVAEPDSSKKLRIETSINGEYFLRGDRYLQKLSGNVRLRQENTLVYCDTALIDDQNATLKGSVIIEQSDTVKVFADSALYFGNTRQSDLFGDVVLLNGQQELFTEKLHYDLANKIATYHQGATLSNGKSQLRSKHGYYFVNDHEIFFKGDVIITDPDLTVRTDTMTFTDRHSVV